MSISKEYSIDFSLFITGCYRLHFIASYCL